MTAELAALEQKVLSKKPLLPNEKIQHAVLAVKQPFPPLINLMVIIFVLLAAFLLRDSRHLMTTIGFLSSIVLLFSLWTIHGTRYYVAAVTDQRFLLIQITSLTNTTIQNQWETSLSDVKIVINETGLFFTPIYIQYPTQSWSLKMQNLSKDKILRLKNLTAMRQLFP